MSAVLGEQPDKAGDPELAADTNDLGHNLVRAIARRTQMWWSICPATEYGVLWGEIDHEHITTI